jgi:hypothetical protein
VSPKAGTSLPAGSVVTLDIAREKAWRAVGTYTLTADGSTPTFDITGSQWRITYTLKVLDCEFSDVGPCTPPTLTVRGAGSEAMKLSEGTHTTYGPARPATYRLTTQVYGLDSTYRLTLVVEQFS